MLSSHPARGRNASAANLFPFLVGDLITVIQCTWVWSWAAPAVISLSVALVYLVALAHAHLTSLTFTPRYGNISFVVLICFNKNDHLSVCHGVVSLLVVTSWAWAYFPKCQTFPLRTFQSCCHKGWDQKFTLDSGNICWLKKKPTTTSSILLAVFALDNSTTFTRSVNSLKVYNDL